MNVCLFFVCKVGGAGWHSAWTATKNLNVKAKIVVINGGVGDSDCTIGLHEWVSHEQIEGQNNHTNDNGQDHYKV